MNRLARILNDDAAPVPRERKGNAVYHAVKRAIILAALPPGEALIEQQIAGAFGCSQGTVREALLRLEHDGLVSRRGYQGTLVSDISAEEAAQMARIRIDLETRGARLAAPAVTAEDVAGLEAIVARMEGAERSHDSYERSELDREFHMAVFRQAGLPALEPILTRCSLHMHRFTFAGDPPAPVSAIRSDGQPLRSGPDQHREIVAAVASGDPDRAAETLRDHIDSIIAAWSPELKQAMAGTQFAPPAGQGASRWSGRTPAPGRHR